MKDRIKTVDELIEDFIDENHYEGKDDYSIELVVKLVVTQSPGQLRHLLKSKINRPSKYDLLIINRCNYMINYMTISSNAIIYKEILKIYKDRKR